MTYNLRLKNIEDAFSFIRAAHFVLKITSVVVHTPKMGSSPCDFGFGNAGVSMRQAVTFEFQSRECIGLLIFFVVKFVPNMGNE